MKYALAVEISALIEQLSHDAEEPSPREVFVDKIRELAGRGQVKYEWFASQLRLLASEFHEYSLIPDDDREASQSISKALSEVRRGNQPGACKVFVAWFWRSHEVIANDFLFRLGYQVENDQLLQTSFDDDDKGLESRPDNRSFKHRNFDVYRAQLSAYKLEDKAHVREVGLSLTLHRMLAEELIFRPQGPYQWSFKGSAGVPQAAAPINEVASTLRQLICAERDDFLGHRQDRIRSIRDKVLELYQLKLFIIDGLILLTNEIPPDAAARGLADLTLRYRVKGMARELIKASFTRTSCRAVT